MECIIQPIGDFPLNDDWAFASNIRHYLKTSQIQLSFWQGFPGIPQFIFGTLFCKLFGFSFNVLRLLSILHLLLSAVILNGILRKLLIDAAKRGTIVLLFLCNPLSIYLANSFQSDVYPMPFVLLSIYIALEYLKSAQLKHLLSLSLFSCLATLNRQSALVLPLVFALFAFIQSHTNTRKVLFILPLIINVLALILFQEWCSNSNQYLPNYSSSYTNAIYRLTLLNTSTFKNLAYYSTNACLGLGLFLLPLSLQYFKWFFTKPSKSQMIALLFFFTLILLKIILSQNVFPFSGNIFYHFGMGPILINGLNSDTDAHLSPLATGIWCLLNVVGGLSFLIVFQKIKLAWRISEHKKQMLLALMIFPLYLLPLCLNYCNDRYPWFLLPLMLIIMALLATEQIHSPSFLMAFIPMCLFGAMFNHDYFVFNRAKWQALNELTNEQKIAPNQIDGGFEFNAWYLASDKNYNKNHQGNWWWVDQNKYIISNVEMPDYLTLKTLRLETWMPFSNQKLFVCKKKP
ncbi:MAG: glycosyltransferase family 39 protein [Bacteroidota bacterium]